MITGLVNMDWEATIPLQIFGPNGQAAVITFIIDTGYNGALSLPRALTATLGLTALAPRNVTLGDDSRKTLDFFEADIEWEGQRRTYAALCVEGAPLLGTRLLRGCKFEAVFHHNGPVTISSLAQP